MQKLAFDIGCNVGNYTKKLLKNGWKVVAVDPNPSLFSDSPSEVERVVAACSDSIKIIPFYFCNANTISSASTEWITNSRFSKNYSWEEHKVKSITIDELVKKYGCPNHIKVDVEGYEITALKGMTKKYADELCFEWAEEQGDMAVDCVKYLESLGYTKFGYIHGDEYLKEPENYFTLDQFLLNFKYDNTKKELWGMIWAK